MKIKLAITVSLLLIIAITAMADHHDELSELIAFGGNKTNLVSVIEKIEDISKGSVIEAGYEKMNSLFSTDHVPYVFRVESITDKGVIEYKVNPSDLKILSRYKDFFPQIKSKESLKGFAVHLKNAVIKAQESGGKALNAEIEEEAGLLIHKIQIFQNNKIHIVAVDPMNGNIFTIHDDDQSHNN